MGEKGAYKSTKIRTDLWKRLWDVAKKLPFTNGNVSRPELNHALEHVLDVYDSTEKKRKE